MGSITTPSPPIPEPTVLLALRTGKLAPLGSLAIKSGIVKTPRPGRIYVSKLGLTDDEHDLTFHGGIDKAIHQYCVSHYALWRDLYPDPEVSARFVPGGFGENLIAAGWSEGNVCVGDVVRIGHPRSVGGEDQGEDEGVLLEVSLPRQPCFKLNQRFGIKNFAGRTHALNRTGWYYRVLTEGWISAGMELRVMERRHPEWTIERLHHNVHRETNNRAATEDLVQIRELGSECRGVFERRLKIMRDSEAGVVEGLKREGWREYRILEKRIETPRIVALTLGAVDEIEGAKDVKPGSHVRLKLPVSGSNHINRAYSVVGGTANRFTLGIAKEEMSRGGSKYIHDVAKINDILTVGEIIESVPLDESASNHLLIAGGIGITAFLAAVKLLDKIHYNFELHYAVRSFEDAAFRSLLEPLGGSQVKIYDKSKGERMDLVSIVKDRKWNSHVYVCGPQKMMDAVVRATTENGMKSDEVHYEAFQAVTSGDPYTAEVLGRKGTLQVGENKTLLEVLRMVGLDVQSSCEVGNCGTCKVNVCSGKVEHRGSALSVDEKKAAMLSCVSRGIGHIVVDAQI